MRNPNVKYQAKAFYSSTCWVSEDQPAQSGVSDMHRGAFLLSDWKGETSLKWLSKHEYEYSNNMMMGRNILIEKMSNKADSDHFKF